jgi:predicted ATPase
MNLVRGCPVTVGRAREMERVHAVLAPDSDAVAVAVSGEAGIGKSRLVQAAMPPDEHGDITVRRGACYLADSLLPFGLFIALSSSPAGDLQSLVNVLGCRRRRRRRWGGRGGATTPGLRRHR